MRKPNSTIEALRAAGLVVKQRRLSRWRTLVILLGIWILCVSLVGFLSLRHAKLASRNMPANSVASQSENRTSAIAELLCSPSGEPSASGIVPSFDEVRAHAVTWHFPIAKDTLSPLDRSAALQVTADDHVLGTHKAQVTLMLFGDLNCPYTLHTLGMLRAWLDEQPAAFRLVWRHRPLDIHPEAAMTSLVAERLALQSSESSFWRFVFALSELNGSASEANISDLQAVLQARHSRLTENAANAQAASKLERDRLIALAYAIHATPTLFVNGLRIEGEISRPHLEQVVNEEREEVQALLDDSVPSTKTYSIRVDANLLELDRE